MVLDGAPCGPGPTAAAGPAGQSTVSNISSESAPAPAPAAAAAAAMAATACAEAERLWLEETASGRVVPVSRHFLPGGRRGFSLGRFADLQVGAAG